MKKIMFNDRYGLTKAVLEGRKTMTRRIIPEKYNAMIEAAKVLVDSVEKYVRQECSRSTLLSMKDKLKELLEK